MDNYHITSPFIREPLPPHLQEIFHLFGYNEKLEELLPEGEARDDFTYGKQGDEESAKRALDLIADHFRIDDLFALAAKNSGQAVSKITFAYPYRPKEERQNQLSRQLSFKLAEVMNKKFSPLCEFSVIPIYQLQDNKRTAVDGSLRLHIQSRMLVPDQVSLLGEIIIPVEHGVESGETLAQMVSVIIRHGGAVPTTVTAANYFDIKLAQTAEQQNKFRSDFNEVEIDNINHALANFGLTVNSLTDYELKHLCSLTAQWIVDQLGRAYEEKKDPVLDEKKLKIIASQRDQNSFGRN